MLLYYKTLNFVQKPNTFTMYIIIRSRSRTNTRVCSPNPRAAGDVVSRCDLQTVGLQSSSHSLGECVSGSLQGRQLSGVQSQ